MNKKLTIEQIAEIILDLNIELNGENKDDALSLLKGATYDSEKDHSIKLIVKIIKEIKESGETNANKIVFDRYKKLFKNMPDLKYSEDFLNTERDRVLYRVILSLLKFT